MNNSDNLINSFNSKRSTYEKYTGKLTSLIEELLKNQNITYHLIESRTKELDSFKGKIVRKNEKYLDLSEIHDISGIRIIVYYPTDISQIVTLVQSEFFVDFENSKILGHNLNVNEFGYLSNHVVLRLNENRKHLSEWKHFHDLNCEIQIRTVLQHAWASISHALHYKTTTDIPTAFQRKLFRLAGLFELADEQFVEIRNLHESMMQQIESKSISLTDQELNLHYVTNFIKTSSIVAEIYSLALYHGFTDKFEAENLEDIDGNYNHSEETWDISELITISKYLEIKTVSELEELYRSFKNEELDNIFETHFNNDRNAASVWYVSPAFILILVLIYAFQDKLKAEILQKNYWDKNVSNRIINNSKLAKEKFNKANS